MSADAALRVVDAQSHLEARLTVVRGRDGGAVAVGIEVANLSDGEVVVKVNTALSAFIMLTVTDEQGTVLSKPARKFSSAEVQQFETVRLAPGSAHHWRMPIAEQLRASDLPRPSLKGRLVVNVLLFSRLMDGEQPADGDYQTAIMTLYDTDVVFTRAALSAGAGHATNGH